MAGAITPGCTHSCWSLPLTPGHSHSTVLCSSAGIQLTSAAVEIQHYHFIYEGWPFGMQLKQEYQVSTPAVLLPGLPPGLSTNTSAPTIECYLQAEVWWGFLIWHLSEHCAHICWNVGAFVRVFATQKGTDHKPDSCVWECLASDHSQLVPINMRIWLMRQSSTVAPWWHQKDMI